jgi:hypothetical protein
MDASNASYLSSAESKEESAIQALKN